MDKLNIHLPPTLLSLPFSLSFLISPLFLSLPLPIRLSKSRMTSRRWDPSGPEPVSLLFLIHGGSSSTCSCPLLVISSPTVRLLGPDFSGHPSPTDPGVPVLLGGNRTPKFRQKGLSEVSTIFYIKTGKKTSKSPFLKGLDRKKTVVRHVVDRQVRRHHTFVEF